MSKIALITGTSTGLGVSIAVQLAQAGYRVYATMRSLEKQQQLVTAANDADVNIHIKQLDVQQSHTIALCVNEIIQAEGKIDLLINNAGAGFVRTTEQASEADINWIMDINFHGAVRCIKAVLPYMRGARNGHIINISSVGGLVGQPFNEIYCAAKFALEGYVESVATYITPSFNINFTNVEPGGIRSEFANSALAHFQQTGGMLDDEYRPLLEQYIRAAQNRSEGVYQTADQVAQVVVKLTAMEQPPIRMQTSPWSTQFVALKTQADPTGKRQQQQVIDMSFN